MKNEKVEGILVSCFACGPNWGSEVGMGWNWIISLSHNCKLHVIAEKGFQEEIETEITKLDLTFPPTFYFIDIGDKGRNLFWKQGNLLFYYYYKKWQKEAFLKSREIITTNNIRLIHQLNLIGFREPGYLWEWSNQIPVIWGPVGGFNQVPLNYIFKFDLKNILFYFGKHLIHNLQVRFHLRVKKAMQNSSLILADSSSTKKIIKKVFNVDTVLMNETGADFKDFYEHPSFFYDNTFRLLWVGKIQGLKSLPIALHCLKKLKGKIAVALTIVGDGPDELYCRQIVKKMDISEMIVFKGKLPNKETKELMKVHDLLFFTSLKEGTPHVVLEAISNGLPVLCHDSCGHGDIINDFIGIKIPMKSYNESIDLFSEKIEFLYNNKYKLSEFSKNEREYALACSWGNKAQKLVELYQNTIANHKVIRGLQSHE